MRNLLHGVQPAASLLITTGGQERIFLRSVINSMLLVFQGSRNERFKQRMRIGRTGFQFRMELDPNIPRMFAFRQFDNFRQFAVRQRPSLNQSMGEEFFLKVVVDS